jgi:hypothetical protein
MVKKQKKASNRGGPRPGSGPKPIYGVKKVTLALRVTPDVKKFLASTGNASETVEELVRRNPLYRSMVLARKKTEES